MCIKRSVLPKNVTKAHWPDRIEEKNWPSTSDVRIKNNENELVQEHCTRFIAKWKDKIQGLFKDFQRPKIAVFKYKKYR